ARIGASGKVIAPKLVALKLMMVARPLNDPAVGEAVWRGAGEQSVGGEVRRGGGGNGLRAGRIAGGLPLEGQGALDAPPPNQITPAVMAWPSGDPIQHELRPPVERADLFLDQKGKTVGKVYQQDVNGGVRLTATCGEGDIVHLRVVPEIHHGPRV